MATLKSVLVTNQDAVPVVKNSPNLDGGRLRRKVSQFETAGAQANGDVLRMFKVKTSDVIHSLLLSCDTLTGATDVNLGFYDKDGVIVGGGNELDDAQTLATALVRQEKRVGSNSALGIETLGQAVWQNAGLTSDPGLEYFVCITFIAAGSASGTIVLESDYTAGD